MMMVNIIIIFQDTKKSKMCITSTISFDTSAMAPLGHKSPETFLCNRLTIHLLTKLCTFHITAALAVSPINRGYVHGVDCMLSLLVLMFVCQIVCSHI